MASEESRKSREKVEHMLEKMKLTEKESRKLVVDDQEEEGAASSWLWRGRFCTVSSSTLTQLQRPFDLLGGTRWD